VSGAIELVVQAVRSQRRTTAWWALGLVVLTVVSVAFWPSLEGSAALTGFDDMDELLQAFGAQNLASPSGYLDGQLYALMLPLLLSAMAIAVASALTAGDEDAGRMEILLALPVRRRDVLLTRCVASLMLVLASSAAVVALVLISRPVFSLTEVQVLDILGASIGCTLLAWFHGAVAFAAAGLGARRATAAGVAVGVLLAGYLLGLVVPLVDSIDGLRHLSPWTWSLGQQPVSDGVDIRWLTLTLIATAMLIAAGTIGFTRRDIRGA
jgi:ABC-2 type transport system permease protein